MPNIFTPSDSYDASSIPDCRDKPPAECAATDGCQVYNGACVPDIRNTIANQFHGNDQEVRRTLGVVTGKPPSFFEQQYRDMAEGGEQPANDAERDTRNRYLAASLKNTLASPRWSPASADKALSISSDAACTVCQAVDGQEFGTMRCCGKPIHKDCFDTWYRQHPQGRCLACQREPEAPYVFPAPPPVPINEFGDLEEDGEHFGLDNDDDEPEVDGMIPRFTRFRNRRLREALGQPPSIPAVDGGCEIGHLVGGSLCMVDAVMVDKIYRVLKERGEDGVVSPVGQQIFDLLTGAMNNTVYHPESPGTVRTPDKVRLDTSVADDLIVEREALLSHSGAYLRYTFGELYPRLGFYGAAGGLTGTVYMETAGSFDLSRLNAMLRTTRVRYVWVHTGGAVVWTEQSLRELFEIMRGPPVRVQFLQLSNFNVPVDTEIDRLRNDHGWARSPVGYGGLSYIRKNGQEGYVSYGHDDGLNATALAFSKSNINHNF
jgi:hypothetical protein